jgi:hypothetical protein
LNWQDMWQVEKWKHKFSVEPKAIAHFSYLDNIKM